MGFGNKTSVTYDQKQKPRILLGETRRMSGKGKPSNTETAETIGKQLFRYAWDYAQRIDHATKNSRHTIDLFSPEIRNLRKKLQYKCEQILLLSCSYRRKTEELLWKKAFYELVQKCKQHQQALDCSSPLSVAYRNHLSAASAYYTELLQKLETQYGITLTALDGSQLDMELDSGDVQWLKAACYRCLLYLGDLARYQVDVGGSPYMAITYYHHAISLDPTRGAPFNQLAVLAGDKNEFLDVVYYYQRSTTSPHPFEGSEVNLQHIFERNREKLEALQAKADHVSEPNAREFTRRILLVRFLYLQQALAPSKQKYAGSGEGLGQLCEKVINELEECFRYDLQLFEDTCSERVHVALSENRGSGEVNVAAKTDGLACLPPDALLKFAALSILPSHCLRLQGSTHTPAATAFALSVFSQLLHYSYRRLAQLLVSSLKHLSGSGGTVTHVPQDGSRSEDVPDVESLCNGGKSMLEVVLSRMQNGIQEEILRALHTSGKSIDPVQQDPQCKEKTTTAAPTIPSQPLSKETKEQGKEKEWSSKKQKKKQKLHKLMHRRRRRHPGRSGSSSEEEMSESEAEEGPVSRSSSEESLSALSESLGEDDLDMMESLSESSCSTSDEEDEKSSKEGTKQDKPTIVDHPVSLQPTPKPPLSHRLHPGGPSTPHKQKSPGSRRKIVLAATFNPPASQEHLIPSHHLTQKAASGLRTLDEVRTGTTESDSQGDILLQQLMKDTRYQGAMHRVCTLAAEDSYLMSLKMFADWLKSYPVVVATCGQGSSTMWSRLATLLNFLPTEEQLRTAVLLGGTPAGVPWSQQGALVEDVALRGFAPLVRSQEALSFSPQTAPSQLEQATIRIMCLLKFGNFVASAKTAPAFTWDETRERFVGPAQKAQLQAEAAIATERRESEQAQLNRSKLMKAMAQQRLQSEVASLAAASAKKQAAIFTPYLVPDAHTLCNTLHIVKKLLKTEKFVFIIAKSVIEVLDGMKKGKENYTAREAIKFLERELQSGNKFIRAQKAGETLQLGRRKPPKQDLQTWHFACLVDCAIFFNQAYADKSAISCMVTLLLDKNIVSILESSDQESKQPQLARILHQARHSGVDIDTMLGFYDMWQSQSSKTA